MARAYPFVLARNSYFDQRPIVVPEKWDVDSVKRTVTEEADGEFSRRLTIQGRSYCAVWRNTTLQPAFVGVDSQSSVRDPNGREITWTEGFLVEAATPAGIGSGAFDQLRTYILGDGRPAELKQRFWDCNSAKQFKTLNWPPFEINLQGGSTTKIRELDPLVPIPVPARAGDQPSRPTPPLTDTTSNGQGRTQTTGGCLLPVVLLVGLTSAAFVLWTMMRS